MRKVGTSYTMYFNIKNDRVGNLFVKPFRSKRVARENHARYLPQYIHLNPAEIFEPGWKQGKVKNMALLQKNLLAYPYSSFAVYNGERADFSILNNEAVTFFNEDTAIGEKLIAEAAAYYTAL
jgi:hypothetical protein